MNPSARNQQLVDEVLAGGMSRRTLLRRAAALGLSAPVLASLIAACGGGSDTPAPTTAPDATSTQGTGAEGTATSAATETAAATGTATEAPSTPQLGSFTIEEPQNKGGTLIEATFADAKTVNSVLSSDTSSARIINLLTRGVMMVNVTNTEPEPDVAKSFEISSDGTEYTFVLHDNVTWHDGQPVTTADVAFTYKLLMDETTGSPRTSELTERIKSVDVIDGTTITFTTNGVVAPFLVSNMIYGLVPEHILKDVPGPELAQHPFSTGQKGVSIGCGPFMFEEWVKDDHLTMTKYPGFFKGEPNLDQYIYKVVPNQTVGAQQLKTGEVDFVAIPEPAVAEMKQESHINVIEYDTFTFTFYAYQLDPAKSTLFQDKEVRQALFYALDRQAMIQAIRFGIGEVAIGTMPKLSWAYNPDAIELKYEYDVEKAKQLLDQAGWVEGPDGIREKDGQKLAFTIYTNAGNEIRENYITVFQQAWKQIGVDCTPQTEEWNAFLDRITGTKDFEIFLVGFSWDTDPDQTTMWGTDAYTGGFNMNKYSNPEVDRLLKAGLETVDQDERKELYTQMQNIVVDDLPSPVLDFPKTIAGVNKRVHNLFPNAVETPFNAHQWWVDA